MDFHTMVTRFRKRTLNEGVIEEEELEELGPAPRKHVADYEEDGPTTPRPKYPFNNLFGNKMRIAIPMGGKARKGGTSLFNHLINQGWEPAFTKKTVKQQKTKNDGSKYTVDEEIPDLIMVKKTTKIIPKGPRKGEEVTQKTKISMGKLVNKIGRPEDKEWWRENQNKLREMRYVRNYFLKPWLDGFPNVDGPPPMIIISRKPIDIARMSDFQPAWHSCHSPDGTHFYGAAREAEGHGAIAYLVRPEDYEKVKDNLQKEEIFYDKDKSSKQFSQAHPSLAGQITPVGRVRIRRLVNVYKNGIEFALPEKRVYGINPADFVPTVQEWARENQKDLWADENGRLSVEKFSPKEWKPVGSSYWDNKPGPLLLGLWMNDERDKAAREEIEEAAPGIGKEHGVYDETRDEFDPTYHFEEEEVDLDSYEERTRALTNRFNQEADNIDIDAEIVRSEDSVRIHADYVLEFKFPFPEGFRSDLLAIRRDYYQLGSRRINKELIRHTDVMDYSHSEDDWEWDTDSEENTLILRCLMRIGLRRTAAVTDEEELEELVLEYENSLDNLLDTDGAYVKAHFTLLRWLTDGGYLPKEPEEKELIKELDETRLFQVSLKLQVEPGMGGGIDAKLNRIRAITGVTVVGHEEGVDVGTHRFVVAKIKFHPQQDSLRPMSYVWEVLVPQINSSRSVPGIKVIEVISGTLKRLDKR
jgi:hypothetical protein